MKLRHQILIPMGCVLLATVMVASMTDAWLAARVVRQRFQRQLLEIRATLADAGFPLTDSVLEKMRGLSGAEFVVGTTDGEVLAASRAAHRQIVLERWRSLEPRRELTLDEHIVVDGIKYLHGAVPLSRGAPPRAATLHTFYPEAAYNRAWWEAVLPRVAVGTVALLVVAALSGAIASRVTRPVSQLVQRVDAIAGGRFERVEAVSRADELQALVVAINRMSEMLSSYEDQVRRGERLQTLDRLGGGIAHQLRNAVTGCRMALDLHQRECPLGRHETVEMARRQLELMEEYLKRFLTLGRPDEEAKARVPMAPLIDDVLSLVRPKAQHLGVSLLWMPPGEEVATIGQRDALRQVFVNLLLNAVDAVAERPGGTAAGAVEPLVAMELRQDAALRRVLVDIVDTGPGPDPGVSAQIFEPLVSGKANGVGLGLAIVREIVARHGGTLSWRRAADRTIFTVDLPAADGEQHGDPACR